MVDIPTILAWISNYKILGMIPLDWTLHFLIGAFITVYSLKKGYSFSKTFFFLCLLALSKELYDYFFHLPRNVWEFLADFLITLSYITVLLFVRRLKRKIIKKEIARLKIYDSQ